MKYQILLLLIFRCIFAFSQYAPEYPGEIVDHSYYTLNFNQEHKQANWVYYSLELAEKKTVVERSDNFREDKNVSVGSAVPADYTKSGYDRGHLCPAADMRFSEDAMSETFYMSNMSPQAPTFNRGIWKRLEEKVRLWAEKEKIYVVTGPVFEDNIGYIGKNKVTIPGYFYKVIYSPYRQQMIAFLLPNTKGEFDIPDYTVSVDDVESITGINFFPQLSDTLQDRLESRSYYERWN